MIPIHSMFFPVAILAITDESDREFMKALYIKYRMTMFRMARSMTDSYQDAEDVVSDACIALIKKIAVLRRLECNVLEGYIISTVKNAAYMLHRKKCARKEVNGDEVMQLTPDGSSTPEEFIIQKYTIAELMIAVDQLSESDQAVIRMKYFQKLSDKEIAETLEIQEVSVRSRLTRSRQRLSKFLGGMKND